MSDDDKYKHLKKHKDNIEKAERIINTTNLEHRTAYNLAVDTLLRNKEGHVDYKKLDENKTALAFADKMAEHYLSRARKELGVEKKGDLFKDDLLMKAYAGTTKSELRAMAGEAGKNFTYETFDDQRKKFMENIEKTLLQAASSHITNEHIEDIIKYTGLDKIKELNKDLIKREEAIFMLGRYHIKDEPLTKSDIKNFIDKQKGNSH